MNTHEMVIVSITVSTAERLCSARGGDFHFPPEAECVRDLTCINLQVMSDLPTLRISFTCTLKGISKINTYANAQTLLFNESLRPNCDKMKLLEFRLGYQ